VARKAVIVVLFVIAALLGTVTGVLFAYSDDLPNIEALDDYNPSTITRVYGADGTSIGEFAVQRRIVIAYDDIAPDFRDAIIASEDAGFNSHFGLSISAIALRLARDTFDAMRAAVTHRRMSRPAGASTLTMQLARNLFPERVGFQIGDISPERKIKEAIVAMQIEKRYTKREILALYANQMLFGHGTYGVEAAARLYFAKRAKDLTLEEAALLAGIVQSPARQSPYVNMDAALRRRAYVLQRMADEDYITQQRADAAKRTPITLHGQPQPDRSVAPYYLEEVRKQLETRYGAKSLYEGGLVVQTTLDSRLQLLANDAMNEGLRSLDRRRGWRRPARNVTADRQTVESFRSPRWDQPIGVGDVVPAVVREVGAAAIGLRVGTHPATVEPAGYAWTHRKPAQLVKAGDLVEFRVKAIAADGAMSGTLEQVPLLEGALLAIENRTGRILAMVGGYSFDRSKFNRATQAARQVGSAFKPFVYTAAIDRGYTPVSTIVDAPVAFPAGPNQPPYSPQNYDHEYWGPITLRRAIEQSRNVPAVKMMDALGPQQVISYARRMGLTGPMPPYLSVALGAAEATLLEMTSAYSVFPNQGVRMAPFEIAKVSDREGNVLEEHRPEPHDAIRADTAYVMTNLLRGVVLRGTAARAASLQWPLAGKTGTTNDYTDAWFIGFDPDVTVGIWIGHDQKKPIGPGFTGTEAALPIWIDFIKKYIGDRKPPAAFAPPGNIVFVAVDRATGDLAGPDTQGAIQEAFIAGTQPLGAARQ
jgi:penicillin-binding protein 1A